MGEMDDIIKEFLIESTEGLDQLDRDFVELEKTPDSKELWPASSARCTRSKERAGARFRQTSRGRACWRKHAEPHARSAS